MTALSGNLLKLAILALVLLVLAPYYLPAYWLHILIFVLWFTYISVCWNIAGGYAGMVSFGHTMFAGLSAYTSTILFVQLGISPWIGMLAGVLIAAIIGSLLAWLDYRFKLPHLAFALISMAFLEIFVLVIHQTPVAGRNYGLNVMGHGTAWWNYQFMDKTPFYFIILGLTLLSMWVAWRFINSRIGLCAMAMRTNERAAEASGVNLLRTKVLVMALSAGLVSLAGPFYAQYMGFIDTAMPMGATPMIEVILFVMLGGMGTYWGPIVGSVVLAPLGMAMGRYLPTDLSALDSAFYGIIIVVVILAMPKGIVPWIAKVAASRQSISTPLSRDGQAEPITNP